MQPSLSQSPGSELHFVSLCSERQASYSNKWLWNSHEPWATLGQQVFLHSRWGRPWIERGQPAAKWRSFQNPVTDKCKHWCNFQGVPKWTPQALALPCNLLSKKLQRPQHPLEERCSVWLHPRDTRLPGRDDAMGMEEGESHYFRGSAGTNAWTEPHLGLAFYCLVALAIKITSKLAPAVSRFHH